MKAWKVVQIAGVLLLLLGVVVRIGGTMEGMWLAVLGVLLYAVGRVAAWLKSDQP